MRAAVGKERRYAVESGEAKENGQHHCGAIRDVEPPARSRPIRLTPDDASYAAHNVPLSEYQPRYDDNHPLRRGNYSFVISLIVITPSSRSAVNETLSPSFTASNIRAS
jgi:hypothetical protein